MYRLNTENGGFTPDKSRGPKARGPKAPRAESPEGFIWRKADVRGFLSDLKPGSRKFLKKKSEVIEYIYLVDVCGTIYI